MSRESPTERLRPPATVSAMARTPQLMLLIGVLLSAAVHVAVAWAAYDQPIGKIDPNALRSHRHPVRLKRATYDEFRPDVRPTPTHGPSPPASVMELSHMLLDDLQPPLPGTGGFEPQLNIRPLDEKPYEALMGELAIDLPPFELQEDALHAATSHAPHELTYDDSARITLVPGVEPGRAGSREARRLLRNAGLAITLAPKPASLIRPLTDEPAAIAVGDRPFDASLKAPPIDFARIALEDTTRLVIPDHLDHDFEYAISRYFDPKGRGFFRADITAKRSLRKLKTMSKDMVLLIDTSGSVPQDWVREVVRGLKPALNGLNPHDRFNIVMFAESPRFFSVRRIRPATPQNIKAASAFLTGAESKGYTDVNAALSRLLVRDIHINRVYELILISDGKPTKGVLDTKQLINLITRDNDMVASIYCLAVGPHPNRELLDILAYRNKGFSVVVKRKELAAAAVRDLISRFRYPLIKDVHLSVAGRGVSQVYPKDLPNVHQGERFSIFGRCAPNGPFTIHITGNNAGRGVDFTFSRELADAAEGDKSIARDWAFWKLHHLYSEIIRRGETKALRDQIKELRKRYKLKTLY